MRVKPQLLCLLLLGIAACTERQQQPAVQADRAQRVREAIHAGSWYPADPDALRRAIDERLRARRPDPDATPIVALIGPHAGLRFSGSVAAAGYAALRAQGVERVFLLGPSHAVAFGGVALPAEDLRAYATPLGELAIDREAVGALRGQPGYRGPARAHDREHSLEMHAIFIAAVLPDVELVPMVVGQLGGAGEVRALASRLRPLLRPGDVVIASSDFTHYGPDFQYLPFSEEVPRRLEELLRAALHPLLERDLEGFEAHLGSTGDTICGREPLRLLMALLPEDVSARTVATDSSGGMTGDFTHSVSYATALYRRKGGWPRWTGARRGPGAHRGPDVLGPEERALALRMARATLRSYLERGRVPAEEDLGVPDSGPLREPFAAFVTLKREGALRGCIGHLLPVQPLWRDIRDNAIAAAVKDARFPPVTAGELDHLELEISVLTRPAPIPSPEHFEVGRHGVLLRLRGRQAVFLPQVAPEQGWDRATTLGQLALKAGLAADSWRAPEAKLAVFEAQVFAEPRAEHRTTRERWSPWEWIRSTRLPASHPG